MTDKQNKHKSYPLNQSPLYKLNNKRKLAELLNMRLDKLLSIANENNNYSFFYINKGTTKERRIEVPRYRLEKIHRSIRTLSECG